MISNIFSVCVSMQIFTFNYNINGLEENIFSSFHLLLLQFKNRFFFSFLVGESIKYSLFHPYKGIRHPPDATAELLMNIIFQYVANRIKRT